MSFGKDTQEGKLTKEGKEERIRKRIDKCVCITESFWHTAELTERC